MRLLAPLGLLVALVAGAALADPPRNDQLLVTIRQGDAAGRREAANALADRIRAGDAAAIDVSRLAVIAEDAGVRGPLLAALISRNILAKATAAQVPTAPVLQRRIQQLFPKVPADQLPVPQDCRVVGGTPRGAELECHMSRCTTGCMHQTRDVSITTGLRWTVTDRQHPAMDDGMCGDCAMFNE